jgi:hypothetical protein
VAPIFVPLFFSLLARKPRPIHGAAARMHDEEGI